MQRVFRRRCGVLVDGAVGVAIVACLIGLTADLDAAATQASRSGTQTTGRAANVVQALRQEHYRRPAAWQRLAAPCLHYLDEAETFHNQGVDYFEQASRARSSPEQSRLVRLGNDAIAERQRLIAEYWACTRRTTSGDEFASQERPGRENPPPGDPGPPFDPGAPPPEGPASRPPGNPGFLPPGFPFPPAEAAPRRSPPPRPTPLPVIVALGDSITAGYGLPRLQAYPEVLQSRLQRAGYRYQVMNAGRTNDTAAGARARLSQALTPNTRILIVALGLNESKAGRPVGDIRKDLAAILDEAQRRGIQVLLCGFEATLTFDSQYERDFTAMYAGLARQYMVRLVPNLLVEVWDNERLVQRDGFHPNAAGATAIANLVYRNLAPMLTKTSAPASPR